MKKNNYPYLECKIKVVKHESQASVGATPTPSGGAAPRPLGSIRPGTPVGVKWVGPPSLKILYYNNGDVPSFTAYLCTYYKKQDPVTLAWEHQVYKKEIISVQPGSQGFFEYDAPRFAPYKLPGIPSFRASTMPIPTSPPTPPAKYVIVSMIFDPINDPLPKPLDEFLISNIGDRHVAYSPVLTAWSLP
jgi:hypothetical protein